MSTQEVNLLIHELVQRFNGTPARRKDTFFIRCPYCGKPKKDQGTFLFKGSTGWTFKCFSNKCEAKTLKDFVRDQAPDLSETLKPKPDKDGVLRLPPMSTLENDDFWRIHAKTINPKHLYREDSET